MQIPSVRGLFAARVGSAMGGAPMLMQAGQASFGSVYANALANSPQQPGSLQELTITGSPGSAQAQAAPALNAIASGKPVMSSARPIYIPASALAKAVDPAGGDEALAQKIVSFAKQFVGTPYVAGGEDLVKGADCSGFVQSVFKHFGIKLPRSSYQQSKVGDKVDVKDLKPGDLLFFHTADYAPVTHVAMYIGNGKIIHASSVKTGVIISNLKIKSDFVIARRIV